VVVAVEQVELIPLEKQAALVVVEDMPLVQEEQVIRHLHLHHRVAVAVLPLAVLVVAVVAEVEQVLLAAMERLKLAVMVVMERHQAFLVQALHTQVVAAAAVTPQKVLVELAVVVMVEHQLRHWLELRVQQILAVEVVAVILTKQVLLVALAS
jgi:hypothetical protein